MGYPSDDTFEQARAHRAPPQSTEEQAPEPAKGQRADAWSAMLTRRLDHGRTMEQAIRDANAYIAAMPSDVTRSGPPSRLAETVQQISSLVATTKKQADKLYAEAHDNSWHNSSADMAERAGKLQAQADALQTVHDLLIPLCSSTSGPLLAFADLRAANQRRLPQFKNANGDPAHSEPDGSDWSDAEWLQAVVGELGEYANVRKKLLRGDFTPEQALPMMRDELADVACYLDILAFRLGIDLGEAVRDKFNRVSERVGSDVKL